MPDPVLLERRGRRLIATIDRPVARNAVNRAVSLGLAAGPEDGLERAGAFAEKRSPVWHGK
jgi:hypothetical protein